MTEGVIGQEKREALARRMEALGIRDADLVERFILGTGAGGQKINKTHSCVYLKHVPSGIEVKCQRGRSRDGNRYFARCLLCDKLSERVEGARSARRQEAEKVRRQKRRRSRRAKDRMLEGKHLNSEKKARRSRVDTSA